MQEDITHILISIYVVECISRETEDFEIMHI